ncbi:unnamed protein product, partial [Porites lobata]
KHFVHFSRKINRSIHPNSNLTRIILGDVAPPSDALEFSDDTDSSEADFPVLHRLYGNYTAAGRNVSRLLDAVFKNYDKRIRPFYAVKPLDLGINLLILSFGELSETKMEFSVDLYMGQFWQDPRLGFGLNQTIILSGEATEKLWVPDTFIVNSIDTKIHKLIAINKKAWIHLGNGTIMLVLRYTARSSCKVDLRDYPLDEQICHLAFESFSFEEKDLNLTWHRSEVGSDIFIYDKEMAQFDILSAKRYQKHKLYHSEGFAGVTATIRFRRRTMYYMFQMYIPCICVVILSWVSFWVDETDGSDRVGLGIATVLTISFMQGALNDNVPRVSYLKSIDYFLLGSFVFVFMTLIEYVLVLKHSRKQKRRKKEQEIKTLERERKRQEALMITEDEDEKVTVTVSIGDKTYDFCSGREKKNIGEPINCANHNNNARTVRIKEPDDNMKENRRKPDRTHLKKLQRRPSMIKIIKKTIEPNGEEEINYLDRYCRVVFPISYAIFLGVYFGIYTVRWENLMSSGD